jgi:hypothetical protein
LGIFRDTEFSLSGAPVRVNGISGDAGRLDAKPHSR